MQITAKGIVWIDMHLRDQRVFSWISERTASGPVTLKYSDIAVEFSCHWHTARAIVKRLQAAGLIEIDEAVKRGGFVYSVVNKCQ